MEKREGTIDYIGLGDTHMKRELLYKIRKIDEIVQLRFKYDNKLFIDPYRINESESELLARAKQKIIKFFELFFQCIEQKDIKTVEMMGKYLHEINATKLGYGAERNSSGGKGFCKKDLLHIFNEAIKIRDYIEDMIDVLIFTQNVGPDKISDLTTNIIYEELLEYTTYIINKYNLEIEFKKKNKWTFNIEENKCWEKKRMLVPFIDDEEILFLPESIVSSCQIFSYEKIYRNLVFPFYKANLKGHALMRIAKNGEEVPDCKKLRKEYPLTRTTVKNFRIQYPEIYRKYKKEMEKNYLSE